MLKMLRQYDRYGYGIFTGMKLSITASLLYVFAMLFHINDTNVLIGLVIVCIGVIELPVVNTQYKKDLLYLFLACLISALYIVLSIATIMPLVIGLLLLVAIIIAVLYRYKVNKFVFIICCNAILIVVFCFAEFTPTNNTLVINDSLSIIEFLTLGFWIHKLYPNRYYKRWQQNYVWVLASLIKSIAKTDVAKINDVRNGIHDLKNNINLIDDKICLSSAKIMNDELASYTYFVINQLQLELSQAEIDELTTDLHVILDSINDSNEVLIKFKYGDDFHQQTLTKIIKNWNMICRQL